MDGYLVLLWILPTDDIFRPIFGRFELPGATESNGIFTAFLNRSDPSEPNYAINETTYSITSTLQIQHLDNLNESSLTCRGYLFGDLVNRTITITVSGEW